MGNRINKKSTAAATAVRILGKDNLFVEYCSCRLKYAQSYMLYTIYREWRLGLQDLVDKVYRPINDYRYKDADFEDLRKFMINTQLCWLKIRFKLDTLCYTILTMETDQVKEFLRHDSLLKTYKRIQENTCKLCKIYQHHNDTKEYVSELREFFKSQWR